MIWIIHLTKLEDMNFDATGQDGRSPLAWAVAGHGYGEDIDKTLNDLGH